MAKSPRKLEELKLKMIMQEDWPFLYNEQRRQELGYVKTEEADGREYEPGMNPVDDA